MFDRKVRRECADKINEILEADGFPAIKSTFDAERQLLEYILWLKKRVAPVYYEREPLQ